MGVEKVKVSLAAVTEVILTSNPYEIQWDTLSVPNGLAWPIQAWAYDQAGNEKMAQVTVKVANPVGEAYGGTENFPNMESTTSTATSMGAQNPETSDDWNGPQDSATAEEGDAIIKN